MKMKSDNYYNVSLMEGEHVREIRIFEKVKPKGKKVKRLHITKKSSNKKTNIESRAKSNHRAKKKIIGLIQNNFLNTKFSFITLTFRYNLEDVSMANEILAKYIRKIRKISKEELKYICVMEFQKRGAIHYHLISNLYKPDYKKNHEYWASIIKNDERIKDDGGSVRVENISNNDDAMRISSYISKYMTKSLGKESLFGKKCYSTSKNLSRLKPSNMLIDNAFNNEKEINRLIDNNQIISRAEYTDAYSGKRIKYYSLAK